MCVRCSPWHSRATADHARAAAVDVLVILARMPPSPERDLGTSALGDASEYLREGMWHWAHVWCAHALSVVVGPYHETYQRLLREYRGDP